MLPVPRKCLRWQKATRSDLSGWRLWPVALLVQCKFVLRDGFEAVERDILETLAAERDVLTYGAVPHAEVVRGTAKIIEAARGRHSTKAA